MTNSKIPFNIIFFMILMFALSGLIYFAGLKVDSAIFYLLLFIVGVFVIAICWILHANGWNFWFERPIDNNNERSALMLVLGIATFGVILFLTKLIPTNIVSPYFFAPVFSLGGSFGALSYSALTAVATPFGTFFIVVIVAMVIEEICLGWGAVAAGSVLTYGIVNDMLKVNLGKTGNIVLQFFGAMIFSMFTFTALHLLNGTYFNAATGQVNYGAFMFAASFRLLMNVLIFAFGNFGLMFSMGVHGMNNAAAIGFQTSYLALTSLYGMFILGFFVLIAVFFVLAFERIRKEGMDAVKDFMTID